MLRLCLVSLLLCVGGCAQAFVPRIVAPCQVGEVGVLTRERSYHALLLALNERKYTILGSDPPRQVEAEYHSSYKPDEAFTRWLIDIAEDGSLHVQSIPAETRVRRKQEHWFARLEASVRRVQCRDPNWLRWEAQNRGLVPLANGLLLSEQPLAAGAETPSSGTPGAAAPPTSPPAPSAPLPAFGPAAPPPEVAARAAALRHERGNIRLSGPIALLATGVALGGGAAGLAQLPIRQAITGCDRDVETCFSDRQLRNMSIGAGAMGVAMVACVAAGATLLVRRLGRMRAIGRELRLLEQPALSIMGDRRGLNLSLRAAF